MSKQIVVKKQEMLDAGWVLKTSQVVAIDADDEEEVWNTVYAWEKNNITLASYSDDFIADCKVGGNNEALFEETGILALRHSFV